MEITNNTLWFFCKVVAIEDIYDGKRIKVRLPYYDDDKKTVGDLPYCFPLLPKHLHIYPKMGEMVLVILHKLGETEGNRFYVGPIISQPQRMYEDYYDFSAKALLDGEMAHRPLENPALNPETWGTLPERTDVCLEGRLNADIVLKDSEAQIRCGYKKSPKADVNRCLDFNQTDLAYVQMKYGNFKDEKGKDFSSITNIVSDRINLLSHDSTTFFPLGDKEKLISDETLKDIFEKAHKLPYGDLLVDFLKKFILIFMTHTHSFPMKPPALTANDLLTLQQAVGGGLDAMLSQSIRIN